MKRAAEVGTREQDPAAKKAKTTGPPSLSYLALTAYHRSLPSFLARYISRASVANAATIAEMRTLQETLAQSQRLSAIRGLLAELPFKHPTTMSGRFVDYDATTQKVKAELRSPDCRWWWMNCRVNLHALERLCAGDPWDLQPAFWGEGIVWQPILCHSFVRLPTHLHGALKSYDEATRRVVLRFISPSFHRFFIEFAFTLDQLETFCGLLV